MHYIPTRQQRRDGGFSLLELIIFLLMFGLMFAIIIPLFGKVRRDTREVQQQIDAASTAQATTAAPNTTAQSTTAPAPSTGATQAATDATTSGSGAPIGLILTIAAVVLGLIVLGFAIPKMRTAWTRAAAARATVTADRAAAEAARTSVYAGLIARQDHVTAAYARYLLDLDLVLNYPALADISIPATADFIHANSTVGDLRPAVCPPSLDALAPYRAAVWEVERTWRIAEAHARKVGRGLLDPAERRKIEQAIALLATARDHAATPHERHACYTKAMSLIEGILPLPEQARAALEVESSALLALTTGSPVLDLTKAPSPGTAIPA